MGVRRLFSRGGKNFPGGAGGGKNIQFALKMPKNILFSTKKVEKHTILSSQGGASAPSCPPLEKKSADAHDPHDPFVCRVRYLVIAN